MPSIFLCFSIILYRTVNIIKKIKVGKNINEKKRKEFTKKDKNKGKIKRSKKKNILLSC